jgi:hypothetical protein
LINLKPVELKKEKEAKKAQKEQEKGSHTKTKISKCS